MKMKSNFCLILVLFFGGFAFAQLDTYDQKIELKGVSDQWHKVILNEAVFAKVNNNLSDLRIYGVRTGKDTLEAPYILKIRKASTTKQDIGFNLLNSSKNTKGSYFTYEIATKESINEIHLDFSNQNFDWRIQLEGSHNLNEWFTILEDHRILSIQNNQTDYSFTSLTFPDSKYRYYRVLINTEDTPKLRSARIIRDETISADYTSYAVKKQEVDNAVIPKNTIVNIDLGKRVPLSFLKIKVSDTVDYYRAISIAYKSDSVNTEKGWKYNYSKLASGILTSIEKNEFRFQSKLAQHLRITIQNQDNQALQIQEVETKGYRHELVTRLTEPATYYLAFGKTQDRLPSYDISKVATNIPSELIALAMGDIEEIPKKEIAVASPLFENKLWLWVVMGLVIAVLGWFTLSMMRKK